MKMANTAKKKHSEIYSSPVARWNNSGYPGEPMDVDMPVQDTSSFSESDVINGPPKPRSPRVACGYKRSVGAYCCVPGCKNSRGRCNRKGLKLSFYSFPKDKKQKNKWLDRIRRAVGKTVPFEPMSHSRVCSAHFVGGCRSSSPRTDAFVPSVFPRNSSQKRQTKRAQTAGEAMEVEMPLRPIQETSYSSERASEDKVSGVQSTDDVREERKTSRTVLPVSPRESDASVAQQVLPNLIVRKRPEKLQLSKVFDEDGPPLPIHDEDDNVGSIRKETTAFTPPATSYTEGEVKYTNKDALKEMAEKLPDIKKETGCTINKQTCDPEGKQYKENKHFVSKKILGQGSFGKVDLCFDFKTKEHFVRKRMLKCKLRASEVIVPTMFDHPNITKCHGLVLRDSVGCQQAITELYIEYGGDSLKNIYSEQWRFNNFQIRNLTKQVLSGLMHLHHKHIIHHDVKPGNICIQEKNGYLQLKITDFGSSSRLHIDRREGGGGTPAYMAPEMCQLFLQKHVQGQNWGLDKSDITGKVDVFSSGVLTLYMYMGYDVLLKVINNRKPTYNMDANTRRTLFLNLMIEFSKDNDIFVQRFIPGECSQNMRDALIGMTQYKHSTRVSARHAFEQIEGEDCMERLGNLHLRN